MNKLKELTSEMHGALFVKNNCPLSFASTQHLISINVTEISKTICSLPVFFSKNPHTGNWNICALSSLEPNYNLFIESEEWVAAYFPTSLQTYPFYLMNSSNQKDTYTIGIDEASSAFSQTKGTKLFEIDKRPTSYLLNVKTLLEASIKNDIHSYEFTNELEKLNLFKAININVHYQNEMVKSHKGLHTIDEDKLYSLSAEVLKELSNKGFLIPISSILTSLFQLNSLIKKHNSLEFFQKIKRIELEISRDMIAS